MEDVIFVQQIEDCCHDMASKLFTVQGYMDLFKNQILRCPHAKNIHDDELKEITEAIEKSVEILSDMRDKCSEMVSKI